jgi:allantoicase
VLLDFTFFVNNNPLFVSIEGKSGDSWVTLAEKTKVKAFAGKQKKFRIRDQRVFSELKVKTFPDGGVNRIRVTGLNSPA